MPTIHHTAIMIGEVQLARDVVVGPHCVLDGSSGPIVVGSGCSLIASVYLTGPLVMGEGNKVYPTACIGFSPQDIKWDPARPGAGAVIGDHNVFREGVTIHRATDLQQPTVIGSDNAFAAFSHVAHDCRVGNHCNFATRSLLGGFVVVDDRVCIGEATGVHQFCRIGRASRLVANSGLAQDLPPNFLMTAFNHVGGLNMDGLHAAHTPTDVIDEIDWVFRTLYCSDLTMKSALAQLRERSASEVVSEYLRFIEQSHRGICQGSNRAVRVVLTP